MTDGQCIDIARSSLDALAMARAVALRDGDTFAVQRFQLAFRDAVRMGLFYSRAAQDWKSEAHFKVLLESYNPSIEGVETTMVWPTSIGDSHGS